MSAHPGPTAERIHELAALVRSQPGSPAFVELGDALIALGRPREAIDVGARGLEADSSRLDGRLMISRAFMMLHQWKQAQAELLRVVKTDRTNQLGFQLLGEVLMRRSDYERALPVLQHAQNLDPANSAVLALLKRARHGQPLDPPAPVPTPRAPAAARPSLPRAAPADDFLDEEPTRAADNPMAGFADAHDEATDMMPMHPAVAAAVEPPSAPPRAAPRAPKAPQEPPTVRPRVMSGEKPKDAAAESLRRSAAMGEDCLNNLLTGGLLDVPNVRVDPAEFRVRSGRRWLRSLARTFIALFAIVFVVTGGLGAWYYYAAEQRDADLVVHHRVAREELATATFAGMESANEELRTALERDSESAETMALLARAGALSALLYGTGVNRAELALTAAQKRLDPDDAGFDDTVVAHAALGLAQLPAAAEPAVELSELRAEISAWLEQHPDATDAPWMRWLQGRAALAAGDRSAARQAFTTARESEATVAVATLELAHMLLDEGKHTEALAKYGEVLERHEGHPLALMGRALAKSELSKESAQVMDDLNVGLSGELGSYLTGYRALAQAQARLVFEDYEIARERLEEAAAASVTEPRFVARMALVHLALGDIARAAELRQQLGAPIEGTSPHPLVALVDAELLLAYGRADAAIEALGELAGVRALELRGRALYDLGRAEEAARTFDEALALAPEDLEAVIWREGARLVAGRGKERRDASGELLKLARQAKSKVARYVHGDALLRVGEAAEARDKLELALADVSDEQPSPLAYRTHVALASLDIAAGNIDAAVEHLQKATEQNPGYVPTHGLLGRILLARGEIEEALASLQRVVDEPALATAEAETAYARALVSGTAVTPEARETARAALRRAKEKGATGPAFAATVMAVDATVAEELGVAEPKASSKSKRRRRR